jgi:ATP-dependent RNA helicase HelY
LPHNETIGTRTGRPSAKEAFIARARFDLDPFQLAAIEALDEGHSVVVAAPTGAGKTLVAEYAVERALAAGGKAFYTTPLKALSNQKYADFSRMYGPSMVGLLTGDNSINGEAPVVVMTTEVLRNMVYAGSENLEGLLYVVLDEVHYLQDPYRGPVWEEVIIHLPQEVDLVCLSATVSNAEELAAWVGTVRGSTKAVIEERRPVPLHNLFLAGDKRAEELVMLPTLVRDKPNPRGATLTAKALARYPWRGSQRSPLYAPRRSEVVKLLGEQGLLPAIYFIFSRAGCDEAVRQALRACPRLTSPEQRRRIREVAEEAAAGLSPADLTALGYGSWLAGLEAGFAAHHAGMVPPFKEAVERCFLEGLVQVVFATETLSLGINMPARSVVIEKLTKFGGERSEPLTPGEYTQLTGRAGRRGIDEVGYAVVLWAPGVAFEQVAALAGARSYTLTSSFRPTYNMATNLVRRCSPDQAHHLLNLSFAQYRSDADIVRLEAQLERAQRELEAAAEATRCERGDVYEYRKLASAASQREPRPQREEVVAAMEGLRPGDVLALPAPKRGGPRPVAAAAVLSTSQRKPDDIAVRAITAERRLVWLGPRDFTAPPAVLGRVGLPAPFAPRSRSFQREVAEALAEMRLDGPSHRQRRPGAWAGHPVAACPELRAHLRAAARADRLAHHLERLEKQVKGRSESLARQFDRVLGLLGRWGYVDGWELTPAGQRLSRLYHPSDLLVAECAERGLLASLPPAEMAALVSVFTYEARGPAGLAPALGPAMPTRRLDQRWRGVEAVAADLNAAEELAGLPLTRPPDAGFAALAYGWAKGDELSDLLVSPEGEVPPRPGRRRRGRPEPAPLSAGDFVRNVKQLIDLLRQLAGALEDGAAATSAAKAADELFRGVIAASSVVAGAGED